MGFDDKLASFQAITGLQDRNVCSGILSAHAWDLHLAVESYAATVDAANHLPSTIGPHHRAPPSLAWSLVFSPSHVLSTAVGFGSSIARNALGLLSSTSQAPTSSSSTSSSARRLSASDSDAAAFVRDFEFNYCDEGSSKRPDFVLEGFKDALARSWREHTLLFVYLHDRHDADTPRFCSGCLCNDVVAELINAYFISWGASMATVEAFRVSVNLQASRFPFCAVVMDSALGGMTVLKQLEGPVSPEEMLWTLQQALVESGPVLELDRSHAEGRLSDVHLIKAQVAEYQDALVADRAREIQIKVEQEQLEKEAAEVDRKYREEAEAQAKAACEAIEKEVALARRREEIATSLGAEPEKGDDVTQVIVRFPTGERKGRKFNNSATIRTLYDYVESLGCLKTNEYILVTNFPRILFGPEKYSLTLKEAGLHPQASLIVEAES